MRCATLVCAADVRPEGAKKTIVVAPPGVR